ncbi:MAG: DHA2 family efflux MFS transporter permease subunit [Armatimonadetes bacterium]|nr:DHA2 family efflux MFS transporter permease subunit [Armatimonadota bacterium]
MSAAISRNRRDAPPGPVAGGADSAPGAPQAAPAENKWLVSMAVIFGVLMSAIDTSVVNVALPNIQGNVGATQQEITWISTGYLISVVILMPLTNWLSLRFGRKKVYLTSLVVFTAASFMCGISRSLGELIFWRVIQGFGAGTLQPLAQAMFREAFPPEQQGLAMGIFGLVVLSGPAIGPTLGGYITDNFNWPWIFFINLPIGVIGFLVALRVLEDPPYMHGGSRAKVDAVGIALLTVGLATLQTMLEQGEEDDWFSSAFICWLTAIAAVSLIGFIWWELTHDEPAVDLRVLKNVTFASGTFIGGILGVGLFASLFLLPQYMQVLLGFDATQSGLALMPRSLTMMVVMPIGGALYNRLGARFMIGVGLALAGYAQWVMGHFTLETGRQDILIPQVIQGVGFALVFVALSTAALATIPKAKMTSATGLNNLIRQLGGSFGTALVVTLLTRHVAQARADLVQYASTGDPAFMQRWSGLTGTFAAQGHPLETARQMALRALDGLIQRQAAMVAYEYIFLWIGLLFALCLPLLLFLKTPMRPAVDDPVVMAE